MGKAGGYAALADGTSTEGRYEEFCATSMASLDEIVRDWVASPEFDALLVDTVKSTYPAHEQDHFIAHFRGLLSLWVRDNARVARHGPLPVVRGDSRVCDARVTRMRAVVTSRGRSARGAGGRRGARPGGTPCRRPPARPVRCRTSTWPARTASARPATRTSKVWFTVADGVLSDVYEPDHRQHQRRDPAVRRHRRLDVHRPADARHDLHGRAPTPPAWRAGSPAPPRSGRLHAGHRLPHRPARATAVVMRTRLQAAPGLAACKLYARFDATVNGNGGGGASQRRRRRRASSTRPPPRWSVSDTNTVTNAVNRDYAVPLFRRAAGRPAVPGREQRLRRHRVSDGLTQLDANHTLGPHHDRTRRTATSCRPPSCDRARQRPVTLALGFGRTAAAASAPPGASPRTPFGQHAGPVRGRLGRATTPGSSAAARLPAVPRRPALASSTTCRVNVVKASEDKTFPGAIVAVASASPWGQAVQRRRPARRQAGLLRLLPRGVRPRPLRGVHRAARRRRHRRPRGPRPGSCSTGSSRPTAAMPRNSLLNGKAAPGHRRRPARRDRLPDPDGLAGRPRPATRALYRDHIKPAADFLVAHGPVVRRRSAGRSRRGYSPSTIAAEIAGLVARRPDRRRHGDPAARPASTGPPPTTSSASIKGWTVTTTGPYAPRATSSGCPRPATRTRPSPTTSATAARTAGPARGHRRRLPGADPARRAAGERPRRAGLAAGRRPDDRGADADRHRLLPVRHSTPGHRGRLRRLLRSRPDGLRARPARPGRPRNVGSGHLWPVLSGERAEQQLQTGDRAGAAACCRRCTP